VLKRKFKKHYQKLVAVARNIAAQHKSASNDKKRKWASLVVLELTHNEMRDLDFEISNNGFNRARKHARTHGAGAEVPKGVLPQHHKKARVTPELTGKVLLCEELSRPSPNRTVRLTVEETVEAARHRRSIKQKKQKQVIPVQVWQVSSVRHAYTVYCQRHPESKSFLLLFVV